LSIANIWITATPDLTFTENSITMVRHMQMVISGTVENTGFRLYALWGAKQMKINGNVSQMPGQIIIEAEGEESDLEQFIQWCKKGPAACKIHSFNTTEKKLSALRDFKIL
jgi:acylphosphatase